MANVGERRRTKRASLKYGADVGERPRTVTDGLKVALKTTKVQAFGGSNPSPSASIFSFRPGLVDEYVETTGAVLGGRDGWDVAGDSRPYGGAWDGPIFVLTHHPEDATPADGVTFLNCGPAETVRIGLEAAGGKNLEVFSPTSAVSFSNWACSTRSTYTSHRSCSARASGCTTTPAVSRSASTWTAKATPRRL